MPRHVTIVNELPEGLGETVVIYDGRVATRGPDGSWNLEANQGLPGIGGTPGPRGPEGPMGPEGPRGEVGPQGPEGPGGPRGADGTSFNLRGVLASEPDLPASAARGDAYFIGSDLWVMGDAWVNSGPVATGPEGPRGPQGLQGERGLTGPQGPAGPPGASIGGGGLRARGSYKSGLTYLAGDIVESGGVQFLLTRDHPETHPIPRVPGAVIPEDRWNVTQRAGVEEVPIYRIALATRTAYLSYSSPSAVDVNPTAGYVQLRTSRPVSDWNFDGLVVEFTVPVVAGAHPVGARLAVFNDGEEKVECTLRIHQLHTPVGSSPTHASVGVPTAPYTIGTSPVPAIGTLVGSQKVGGGRDFYAMGYAGDWPAALWLGEDRKAPHLGIGPLDLSEEQLTFLITVGPESFSSDDARIRTTETMSLPGPQLVVEYAPTWQPLSRTHTVTRDVDITLRNFCAIDPSNRDQTILPSEGSISVPPYGILLAELQESAVLSNFSRVELVAPWSGSTMSRLRAHMAGGASLTDITWANAPESILELGTWATCPAVSPLGEDSSRVVVIRNGTAGPVTLATTGTLALRFT